MDKVIEQKENDFTSDATWVSYAKNNDEETFNLLYEKGFPEKAAKRYEQNDEFFSRFFNDPEYFEDIKRVVLDGLYLSLKGM